MQVYATGVFCLLGLWMNSLTLITMTIGSGTVLRYYPLCELCQWFVQKVELSEQKKKYEIWNIYTWLLKGPKLLANVLQNLTD